MISYTRDLAGGGWRGRFILKNGNGTLRTGVPAGSFTATIVNPQDTALTTPTVGESVMKSGVYSFLILDTFLETHGLGGYGGVIEVLTAAPVLRDSIDASFGFFEGTVERRANAWFKGRIEIQNDDELVYYGEDGVTRLYRSEKLDLSREVRAP